MNLLQIFFIITGFLLVLIWYDFLKKRRLTKFQIFILFFAGILLLIFNIYPVSLHYFWKLFWVSRWAYVLIYMSIIFLWYISIFLLNKIDLNNKNLTDLIKAIAIEHSKKKEINWNEVFIIPCYNEGMVIKDTIDNIINAGYKNIVVINDWSVDNSRKILEKMWDKIILLNHFKNRWQWAALETGFEYIRRYWNVNYIITFDSDWQHDLKDLDIFFNAFKKDDSLDIVLWSRFIWNAKDIPFLRKLVLNLWKIFTLFMSGKYFTDVHNWYRVLKKSTLDKLNITIDGMAHASEIQDIIATKKLKFTEVPVNIIYTDYSLSKWQKSVNAINIALKIVWEKFFK